MNEEFDALAPMPFEPREGEGYYVEYVPPIEKPEEGEELPEQAPLSPLPVEERLAKTVKGMPGQKRLLYAVIDWCREEHDEREIVEYIAACTAGTVEIYAPETILRLLERSGALICTNAQEVEEAAARQDAEPREEAVEGDPADAVQAADEEVDAVTVEFDEEEMVGAEPPCRRYLASPEALSVVAADDPCGVFASFLADNMVYAPIFERILVACDEEGGCVKKRIDALVDTDPLCQNPRRFSGYFVDKLEEAGAIEFLNGWHTTDTGRAMLEPGGCLAGL